MMHYGVDYLASDLSDLEQRRKQRKHLVYVTIIVVCGLFVLFAMMVGKAVCDPNPLYSGGLSYVIALSGCIPTVLMLALVRGLFNPKDQGLDDLGGSGRRGTLSHETTAGAKTEAAAGIGEELT